MSFYSWLCLYVLDEIVYGPSGYYVYMWFIFYFGMMCVIVGSVMRFLIPPVKKIAEEPLTPSRSLQRHRRPEGVADPYLQELVDRRRNARLSAHREPRDVFDDRTMGRRDVSLDRRNHNSMGDRRPPGREEVSSPRTYRGTRTVESRRGPATFPRPPYPQGEARDRIAGAAIG